jgi:L-lactate dehydrogenase (cytochrome)
MKFEAEDPSEVSKAGSGGVDRSQGAARAISVCTTSRSRFLLLTIQQSFIDPGLNWDDLKWFKSITRSMILFRPPDYTMISPTMQCL